MLQNLNPSFTDGVLYLCFQMTLYIVFRLHKQSMDACTLHEVENRRQTLHSRNWLGHWRCQKHRTTRTYTHCWMRTNLWLLNFHDRITDSIKKLILVCQKRWNGEPVEGENIQRRLPELVHIIQGCSIRVAREKTKWLFDVEVIIGTWNISLGERKAIAEYSHEHGNELESLSPQSEGSALKSFLGGWGSYLTISLIPLSRSGDWNENWHHYSDQRMLADITRLQATDSITDIKCCSISTFEWSSRNTGKAKALTTARRPRLKHWRHWHW